MKKLTQLLLLAAMLLPWVSWAQFDNYYCTFEDANDTAGWFMANSTNAWVIGTAVANGGTHSMYVSDGGNTHTYNSSATSFSYAYREFELTPGGYFLSFDWLAYGESSWDFIRVYLVPSSVNITAGVAPDGSTSSSDQYSSTPANWIALDGGQGLCYVNNWQNYNYEFNVSATDTFKLVFMWCNDGSAGSNPPGAIDNIVFAQPTCPKPFNLTASNITTNSFDITWQEAGEASEWIVELDSAGQSRGQGLQQTLYDTSYSFFGLSANTDYSVYVAAVCGGTDTSLWVRYNITTPCSFLTSVPYFENFEGTPTGSTSLGSNFLNCWYRIIDATSAAYPYVANSSTYSHNGGSRGLYWYHPTASTSYGTYQCIVLPGLDTDSVAMQSLQLTFWGKASSASYRPNLYVGVMSNPNDINTFHPVDTIHIVGAEWAKYVASLAGCADSCNYIAVLATMGASSWYAYLDEFTIERAPACRVVSDLQVSHVANASAYLTWDLLGRTAMPSEFAITLTNLDDSLESPMVYSATEQVFFLTDLAPATRYEVQVDGLCNFDTVTGESIIFTTGSIPCMQMDVSTMDTILFSNATSGTSGCLAYSSWGNTAYQTIYTAAELAAAGLQAGPVIGIDLGFTPCSNYNKEFSIYIGNSNVTNITSATLVNPANHQLVYGPALHQTGISGWQHYNFSEPFMWDGSSSIMITTFMNQYGGSQSSSSGLMGYSVSAANKAAYRYQDGTPYTTANINSGNSGSTYSYRAAIHFYTGACDERATCVAPNVIVTRNEVDTVSIVWAAGLNENGWDLAYKLEADSDWTVEATGLTDTHYDFTNLQPMNDYLIRVYPNCGGDSIFAELSLTTPCVPVTTLPFTEDFENFTATSAVGSPITPCWFRGTNYSTGYPYISTGIALSGTHSLYFYAYTSSYAYIALPAMAASLDSLQVSFAARYSTAGYTLYVGVMTDPEDITTFTQLGSATLQSANTWEMFEIPLSGYTGQGGHIAIVATSATTYAYLDDIEVDYIPSCPRPRNVNTPNPTLSSATIYWDDSTHHDFEIEYGPSGFAHGNGTITYSTTDSVAVYGLNHSTRYDVYVRAVCEAGDTSAWSFVSSFITACGAIDTLPWSDNFSSWGVGSGARPSCWTSGGYGSYPYIQNVSDGSGAILRQTYNLYSNNGTATYFSLPELDSADYPVHTVQVIFKAWSANFGSTSYSHDLVVGVCSQPGVASTFTPVDTIQLTASPLEYEVSFETVPGAGQYVSFYSYAITNTSAYYNYAYIDSVALEAVPDCQAPNRLAAQSVQTYTADVVWHDRANAAEWQIEYGPRGFALGYGTRATAYAAPHTLVNLNSATDYDFYVRTVCNVGDTSDWSRTPGQFATMQNPAPVPYFWNCEDSIEWANWQISTNKRTITWYRGTGAGNGTNGLSTDSCAIYISADSGATCSTNADDSVVNAACYRDFDFGTADNSFRLTFRAKAGGTVNNGYDGLMALIVDPNIAVEASDASITSPWGDVRYLTPLNTIHYVPNWNTYTAVLDTLTGVHRIAFFWFNQGTNSSNYPFRGGAAAVDDIKIEIVDCARPAGIVANNVTMASAEVTWHGDPTSTYYVSYRSLTDATPVVNDTVNTNIIYLNGLNPGSRYQVNVTRRCDDTTTSAVSEPGYFTTLVCNDALVDTIGAATSTNYYLPTNNYYNYSYTQQIITADELGGSGDISSIVFNYAYSSSPSKTNCTIYLGHTSLSSFTSADDFVSIDNLQRVYSGGISPTEAGWKEIAFQTPFTYNGTDNLVIAIDDNSNHYASSSCTYYTDNTPNPMAICYYSDTEDPEISSDSLLRTFSGNRSLLSYRNQMVLTLCPPNPCPVPTLVEPRIIPDQVTLRWNNTSSLYAVSYRRANSTSWTADNVQVEDTFFVISSVWPSTDYVYRVRQYCDSTGISNWTYGEFNTGDIDCLPPDSIWVESVSHNKAKLKWTTNDSYRNFVLHVYNTTFDHEYSCAARSKTVTGLQTGVTYYAQVMATCQGMDEPSEYGEPISFTTSTCTDATDLVSLDVQGNTARVDWTPGGQESAWEVRVGYPGFSENESLLTFTTDEHPFTITNLSGSTDYDVYVRGICGEGFYSMHWSNLLRITTQYSSITSVTDDCRVRLFPNPTDGDVQLTLPASHSGVLVEVLDLTGRVQQSYRVDAGCEEQGIRSSRLAQGAYFVRISGEEINTVKKLVVR